MPILPIQIEGSGTNSILRANSKEVADISAQSVQQLIRDMHETLASTENGVGLAAPQVGVNLRIFVAAPELDLNQTVFINPVITKQAEDTETMEEGCLSLPGLYGRTKRSPWVKVEAYNENGRKFKMKVQGLPAQLMQHEIGHLGGELFKDHATELFEVDKIEKKDK